MSNKSIKVPGLISFLSLYPGFWVKVEKDMIPFPAGIGSTIS